MPESRKAGPKNMIYLAFLSTCRDVNGLGPLCAKKASSSVCVAVMDTFELQCQKCRNEKNAQES